MVLAPEVELWFVREVLPLEASSMRFLRSSFRNAGELADLRQDIYAELNDAAFPRINLRSRHLYVGGAAFRVLTALNRLAAVAGPIWVFVMFLLMFADYFAR
jgi:hypothetical protein